MDKRTTPKAAVLPGYGNHTNQQRREAWERRRDYRDANPAAQFPIAIYRPEK